MKTVGPSANKVIGTIVLATCTIIGAGALLLWPAYTSPTTQLYTSPIGYLHVQRLFGMPFHVNAVHPTYHDFSTPVLGEGMLESEFYNVPIIPAERVTKLAVAEGDSITKGQLLAELDETIAAIGVDSARLALASALAEQQRVEVGSVNTLVAERPEKDLASLEGLVKVVRQAQAQVDMYRELESHGSASRVQLVSAEIALVNAETTLQETKINRDMSVVGLPQSKQIAQNAVQEAQNTLRLKQDALKGYHVVAPVDGIIDRVLIRPGEYNQAAGNTGFVIASGLWFEANLDQRAVAQVQQGMDATVHLEAYAGRTFTAQVQRVIPIVTFNAGGPETTSPVRPLGTGSPEWPATFRVLLNIDAEGVKLTPGMTGFARILSKRSHVLAVPREALLSISSGKGVVRTVDRSGRHTSKLVSIGEVDDRFVEITDDGLTISDWVLAQNPRFLEDDDKIDVIRIASSEE